MEARARPACHPGTASDMPRTLHQLWADEDEAQNRELERRQRRIRLRARRSDRLRRSVVIHGRHKASELDGVEVPELSRLAGTVRVWEAEILAFHAASGYPNGPPSHQPAHPEGQ